jgi:hypothetical protein
MRKAILLITLLFTWTRSQATTILVLYTPNAVFFGADSRLVIEGRQRAEDGTVCKIHISDNLVWASAGLLAEAAGPFDLRTIAAHALRDDSSFRSAVRRLKSDVASQYQAFRNRAIEDGVNPTTANTNIAISGFDKHARLTVLHFGRSDSRISCPGKKCPEFGLEELGEHRRIDSILNKDGYFYRIWKEKGIPAAFRYLISAEEAARPQTVGGPISVLQLDKTGPHWIYPGVCK